VSGLSRLYHEQQQALGARWFGRGVEDLNKRNYSRAVTEFRAALVYSRDDYSYQLNLAQALLGMQRTAEASAYLANLWDREPDDGLVNLELARIAARQGETNAALRYYHNAIYATWSRSQPEDPETARRTARLELADYLLRNNATEQAQAELIALAANLGTDPAERVQAGDYFLRARDYEHALEQYRESLKAKRRYPAALAGAGLAAFELGRYDVAAQYWRSEAAVNPNDTVNAAKLQVAETVIRTDPFRAGLTSVEKGKRVIDAFNATGRRMKFCPANPGLQAKWEKLKPQMTSSALRRNPDLMKEGMEVVFSIEQQSGCGSATPEDEAMVLIARARQGTEP